MFFTLSSQEIFWSQIWNFSRVLLRELKVTEEEERKAKASDQLTFCGVVNRSIISGSTRHWAKWTRLCCDTWTRQKLKGGFCWGLKAEPAVSFQTENELSSGEKSCCVVWLLNAARHWEVTAVHPEETEENGRLWTPHPTLSSLISKFDSCCSFRKSGLQTWTWN